MEDADIDRKCLSEIALSSGAGFHCTAASWTLFIHLAPYSYNEMCHFKSLKLKCWYFYRPGPLAGHRAEEVDSRPNITWSSQVYIPAKSPSSRYLCGKSKDSKVTVGRMPPQQQQAQPQGARPQLPMAQRNFLVLEYHKRKDNYRFLGDLMEVFQATFPGARMPSKR